LWMTPLSVDHDSNCHDDTGHKQTIFGLTKVTLHPATKVGLCNKWRVSVWQTSMFHVVSICHRPNWRVACSSFTWLMMSLF